MPADPRAESEWQSRKRRIDPVLAAQGWTVVPFDPARSPAATRATPSGRTPPTTVRPTTRFSSPVNSSAWSRPSGSALARKEYSPRPSILEGRCRQPLHLPRLPRAITLRDQRRSLLVPRCPPPAELLPADRALPHAGGARGSSDPPFRTGMCPVRREPQLPLRRRRHGSRPQAHPSHPSQSLSRRADPPEADLARADGRDYELASAVLARIRAERADDDVSIAVRARKNKRRAAAARKANPKPHG